MQDDVTDGARRLIADGIADPKRICIVGASYGGYAALAGAAFTPDYTVRIDQGEAMNRALERAGKKVTFITIKGETHHMQMTATRVLSELEKFLKENIGD